MPGHALRPRHAAWGTLAAPALSLLLACTAAPPPPPTGKPPAAAAVLAPPAAMRVEGAPPLDAALVPALRRYAEVVGHGIADWHPTARELLVVHRAPGQSTAQIHRLRRPLGPLEPLTAGADPVTRARWEPGRGRFILFERASGGDEAYQLFRLDPDTRAATPLMPAGERHALVGYLPSRGRALVASVPLDRTVRRSAPGGAADTAPPPRRAELTTRLTLVDPLAPEAPGGRRVVAELPGTGWFGGDVSSDETRLAITRYVSATQSEAWMLDLPAADSPAGTPAPAVNGTANARRLLPAAGETQRAAHLVEGFTPDGRGLLLQSDRAGEFRELMRLDLADGRLARLTAHIPWDVDDSDVAAGQALAPLRINVDGRDELRLIDLASGSERALPAALPPGGVSAVRLHRASGEVAFVTQSAQGPGQVHSLDPASGRVETWTRIVAPSDLDLAQVPAQQIVRWKSFDGRTLSGVLSLPPARFPGRRPVLIWMHGGPEGQSKLGWNGRMNYLLMERGIALFEPNVRGSSGCGKTFLDLDNGRARENSVRDMESAIDCTATHPRLDAARVVVYGGSYGGYMALAAAVLACFPVEDATP